MKIEEVQVRRINSGKVVGQAKINFGWFWLSGFKICVSDDDKNYVTAPSYKNAYGWKSLFITIKKTDWEEIQEEVLKEFNLLDIKEATQDM